MKKDYSNIDVDYNNLKNEDLKLLRKGANLIITYNGEKIRLKKVIQSHQNNNMMTMTELKKNKLQPDAPPIAWCFQQWSGEIFYYYDKNKVKPLQITDKERQKRKEYIKDLKRRKTCPICKKVQNKLENLNFHTLYNPFSKNKMQRIYSCNDCYDKKEYEILLMKRNEKHDFTTCFTEQGINLNEDISKEEKFEKIYLDFETTGLDEFDEILQIAMINEKGRVLFYKLFKPNKETWDEAMEINKITPTDVKDAPKIEEYIDNISDLLTRTQEIICYNVEFEKKFLNKYNIKYTNNFQDCMIIFAKYYGEWSEYFEDYKWKSLSFAAQYLNYNFKNSHNSLSDVFATKYIYEKLMNK